MSNTQVQAIDLNAMFTAMMFMVIVVGMTKTFGSFLEPARPSKKHPPSPVAKVVTVPGGSRWRCAKCGVELEPGSEAVKLGAKVYCVPCARSGNPGSGNSGSEEQIERIPLSEEFKEFIQQLPFMPERGKPLPEYVYKTLKPKFVTDVMKPAVSAYGRELADRVALDTALFLKGGNFELVDKLDESGWSSEDIIYDARVRHKPTNTEWDIEVYAPFDWRKPETYKDGFAMFLPDGEELPESDYDLTLKGGEEAGRTIEEFVRSRK